MLHQPWPPMKTHGLPVFESLVALARKILNRPWLGVLATAKWYLLMALLGNYVPKSCNLTPPPKKNAGFIHQSNGIGESFKPLFQWKL